MQKLDERVVRISIQVDNRVRTYEDLYIKASGVKYGNANQNECTVTIFNLNKETRNEILTSTSPYNNNQTPKILSLFAGRQSTGVFLVYSGDITISQIGQPPDIPIVLKCATQNFQKGNVISRSASSNAQLSQISINVANDLGLTLNFQATDKQIANYQFNGGALNQVDVLGETGGVDAFVDDNNFIVKNRNQELSNSITILNKGSGMIGIPETTEQGIKVKFLITTQVFVGGLLRVESVLYPQTNGDYVIYQLGFEIANRDTEFYWVASAKRK